MSSTSEELYRISSQATTSLIELITNISSLVKQRDAVNNQSLSSSQLDSNSLLARQHLQVELTKASCQLLKLKQTQRSLGLLVGSTLAKNVTEARKEIEAQALTLQNLIYEKNHLQNEIRRDSDVPYLVKMAKVELCNNSFPQHHEDQKYGQDNMNSQNDDAIVDSFLAPSEQQKKGVKPFSHRDPLHHSYNLAKMRNELTLRETLQQDHQRLTEEKIVMDKSLTDKNFFLNGIPDKLLNIEKSTMPLQDYFIHQNRNMNQSKKRMASTMLRFTGTKRKARLEYASKLSGPLYTLFVQFQSYLDANSNTECCRDMSLTIVPICDEKEKISSSKSTPQAKNICEGHTSKTEPEFLKLVESWLEKDNKAVQLSLPLPHVSPNALFSSNSDDKLSTTSVDVASVFSSKRTIKIQFEYFTKLNLITAHVVGETASNISLITNDEKMLSEMFLWNENVLDSGEKLKKKLLLLKNLFLYDDGVQLPNGNIAHTFFSKDDDDNELSDNGRDASIQHDDLNDEEYFEDGKNEISQVAVLSLKKKALLKAQQRIVEGTTGGKPYYWCQYIAGLHYPSMTTSTTVRDKMYDNPPHQINDVMTEPNTEAVMKQLCRRIRSHVTLVALLNHLEQKMPNPIPISPSMAKNGTGFELEGNMTSRLIGWNQDDGCLSNNDMKSDQNNITKRFVATIKRNSVILRASVEIDVMYPAIPPFWSLQSLPESLGSENYLEDEQHIRTTRDLKLKDKSYSSLPSLYHAGLSQIESQVNSLENVSFNEKDKGKHYDWVLMYQLKEIIVSWDKMHYLRENQNTNVPLSQNSSRRGRDRQCDLT